MSPPPHPPRPLALLGLLLATLVLAVAPGASAAAPAAFTGAEDPGLPALITSLRGCLTALPQADSMALTLRAGLDGHAPRPPAAVAVTFARTPAAESAAEVTAIRKLEAARRRGLCQAQPPAAAAAARPPAARTGAPASSSPSSSGTTDVLSILLPALLALAFVAGISRELLRDPRTQRSV
ncbi:MAG: hypothetical protein QOF77_685 [Solirubrobacteraceae bacterium]|nr:hypothetical protein [Solirubrobacteraceae bacterium]